MIQEHDACELTGLFLKQFYSYARLSKRVRIKLSDFQRNRPPSLNFGRFLMIIRGIFLNCLNGLILSILIASLRGYVQNMQPYSQHGQKSTNKFKLLLGPEGGRVEDSRPVFTRAKGAELRFRRCVLFFLLFLFLSVSHLNMQASFACGLVTEAISIWRAARVVALNGSKITKLECSVRDEK